MKAATILFLFAISIITCLSCSKGRQVSGPADFIIVGQVGGFVMYTPPFYKLTANQLLEDSTRYNYTLPVPTDVNKFNFNYTLPAARFDTVKYLLSSIPEELFTQNNADIGMYCPDFGYTDVRASVNGVLYKWSFECNLSNTSIAVQQFVQHLRADF